MDFLDKHQLNTARNFVLFSEQNKEFLRMPELKTGSSGQYIQCLRMTEVTYLTRSDLIEDVPENSSDDRTINIYKKVCHHSALRNHIHAVVINGLYFEWNYLSRTSINILLEELFIKSCRSFARLYRDQCSL